MGDVCHGPCVEPGLPWALGLFGLAAALFLLLYYLEMGRRVHWRDFAAWFRDFRGRG